jgi:hypothetical protein
MQKKNSMTGFQITNGVLWKKNVKKKKATYLFRMEKRKWKKKNQKSIMKEEEDLCVYCFIRRRFYKLIYLQRENENRWRKK